MRIIQVNREGKKGTPPLSDRDDTSLLGRRKGTPSPNRGKRFRFSLWYFLFVLGGLAIFNVLMMTPSYDKIEYSTFKGMISSGVIKRVKMTTSYFYGYDHLISKEGNNRFGNFIGEENREKGRVYRTVPLPLEDPEFLQLLTAHNVEVYADQQRSNTLLNSFISWILPLLLILFVWRLFTKKMGNFGGSNVMNFGQNRSRIVADETLETRFKDVAGCEEAKEELVEVVDFLKSPGKYTNIGGKIPKGVLLVGPPGTGKTLLARAVAGEAEVTFFRMSGADFVEMFVGVGASRVRDLFKQAREKAPCIIFIDELDAIGKTRAAGLLSSNDEREQTLNQLLVEMDGFDSTSGVILLAATNRPEVLDPALLRPGRFDRQIVVDRPDLQGREAILRIHSKEVLLEKDVSLEEVARATPGFVGADLANVINEAALLAVRGGRSTVLQDHLEQAVEKLVAGLEKKNRLINPREREIVAYHETGHALVAVFTPDSDPVKKISIVPRGMGALGYTLQTPLEDRFLMTEDELLGRIDVLLGGRAAEMIIYGKLSTGAANDIQKATDIAKSMITVYGMSERFRNVVFSEKAKSPLGLGPSPSGKQREYAEETQQYIDEQIASILQARYAVVRAKLLEHKTLLEKITDQLLSSETLCSEEFFTMIENDPNGKKSLEKRKSSDALPSQKALEYWKKRNNEILLRTAASSSSKEPPRVHAQEGGEAVDADANDAMPPSPQSRSS